MTKYLHSQKMMTMQMIYLLKLKNKNKKILMVGKQNKKLKILEITIINKLKTTFFFRSSVSAEAFGNYNKKADFKPKIVPKRQE